MSCRRFHPLLALWVGGDLTPRRALRVEKHLAGCSACRVLADRLSDNRSLVARLAEPSPDTAGLHVIRQGVLEHLREGPDGLDLGSVALKSPRVRWAPALATALVLVATGVAILIRHGAQLQQPSRSAAVRPTLSPFQPTPPAAIAAPKAAPSVSNNLRATSGTPEKPRQHATRVRALSPTTVNAAAEATVIKIVTDDPDVVMYWLAERGKG